MRLRLPREHGLTSVWLASLVYGLAQVSRVGPLLGLAVAAAIMVLLHADGFLDCFADRRLRGCIPGFTLIFAPYLAIMVLEPSPIHMLVVVLTALLAAALHASTRSSKVTHYSTIAGGTLISLHAYFIMAAGGANLLNALFLPLYTAMSVAQAALRVIGWRGSVQALLYTSMAATLLFAATLFPPASLVLLVGDVVSRIVQEASGISSRMSVKRYGLTELIRGILVLGALGILLR